MTRACHICEAPTGGDLCDECKAMCADIAQIGLDGLSQLRVRDAVGRALRLAVRNEIALTDLSQVRTDIEREPEPA